MPRPRELSPTCLMGGCHIHKFQDNIPCLQQDMPSGSIDLRVSHNTEDS